MSDNNAESVEQIRKVFARDLKVGEALHTVFRAAGKQKNTSRSGKSFLALTLSDKTGTVDARVFENIEAADQAFNDGDYLLLAGRVVSFHGKPQVVIDRIERLDPAPMDPREFTPPPAPEPKPADAGKPEAPRAAVEARAPRKGGTRGKLLAIFEDPTVAAGADALLHHLEQFIDERVTARVQAALARAGQPGAEPKEPREPREPRRGRGPRPEPRRGDEAPKSEPHKATPARDPSLPKEFAFKPFNLLTTSEPAAAPAASEAAPAPQEPAKPPEGA